MLRNSLLLSTQKVEVTSFSTFEGLKKSWIKGVLVIAASLAGLGSAQAQSDFCDQNYDREGTDISWKVANDNEAWLPSKYRNVGIGKLYPTAALHIGNLDDGVTERSNSNLFINGLLLESCGRRKVFLGIERDIAVLNSAASNLHINSDETVSITAGAAYPNISANRNKINLTHDEISVGVQIETGQSIFRVHSKGYAGVNGLTERYALSVFPYSLSYTVGLDAPQPKIQFRSGYVSGSNNSIHQMIGLNFDPASSFFSNDFSPTFIINTDPAGYTTGTNPTPIQRRSRYMLVNNYLDTRTASTDLEIVGPGPQYDFSNSLKLSALQNKHYMFASKPLVLQSFSNKVGIGSFSTDNFAGVGASGINVNDATSSVLSLLHVKGSTTVNDAELLIESKFPGDEGASPMLSFGGTNKAVFSFNSAAGSGTALHSAADREFWFMEEYSDLYGVRNGKGTIKVFGNINYPSQPLESFLSLSHDGEKGVINTGTLGTVGRRIDILPNGGSLHVGTNVPQAGSYTLSVNGTGWLANGPWVSPDAKLKKNISTIKNGLSLITQLNPVAYNFKADTVDGLVLSTKNQLGFIAQELAELIPEAVQPGLNGYLAVNYSMVIPVLTKAIQEQQVTIDSLKIALASIPKPAKPVFNTSDSKGSITTEPLKLWQNAPNPTNGKTEISYAIPSEVVAYLELHDLSGNKVYKSEALAGSNKLSLDLTGNMPGVYVYTLYANGFEPVIKSLILTR